MKKASDSHRIIRSAVLLPLLLVVCVYTWQGMTGFSLRDEGFLWYGAREILTGGVPMRDFMAYDPGRYYALGALMALAGENGIGIVRVGVVFMQWCAMCGFLLLCTQQYPVKTRRHEVFLLIIASLICVWMFPRHKIIDTSMSLVVVTALGWFLAHPDRRGFFWTGVVLGVVAFFGRNHGVYGLMGAALLAVLATRGVELHERGLRFGSALLGLLVGSIPQFVMLALVPGYAQAFVNSLLFLVQIGGTNAPLPFPVPWRLAALTPTLAWGQSAAVSVSFVALCVGGVTAAVIACLRMVRGTPLPPLFTAAAVAAVFYTQTALSRADLAHIAQSYIPFVIAVCLAVWAVRTRLQIGVLTALVLISLIAVGPSHPGVQCWRSGDCQVVTIGRDDILMQKATAREVAFLRTVEAKLGTPRRSPLLVPFWPGAYALLGHHAPVWEIYPIWPRDEAFEQAEIDRLSAAPPPYVIWSDADVDDRSDLRYSVTHPNMTAYILAHYRDVPALGTATIRVLKVSDRAP